ncbi:MAG: hypothetical protein ACD_78C00160G0003 [uncultured bacterium (gcode 4)]|uniref:Uncharacterized protein n=1 Tax=uncultured bacterium (gcode 4) TaxID=1234023 RepID=K1XY69_9BACT|nr:MAG: hypothetical protein ACD_78C00160G0003 [uncultured bacterium (gcode 4)]
MGEIRIKNTLSVSDTITKKSCQRNEDTKTQKASPFICIDEKGKETQEDWAEIQKIIPKLQDLNGLFIEMKDKNHFYITHPKTGAELSFALWGIEEAMNMQLFLSKAMIVQNTCFEKQKLLDSCQVYMKADFLNTDFIDLYIDNNPYIIGLDEKLSSSESMESIVRWPNNKRPLSGGIPPFARAIINFLNQIRKDI